MTIGMILLIIVAVLILLGVGQRVLDRLRLNDKLALLFIALIIGLGFVPDIRVTEVFAFNLAALWFRWRCASICSSGQTPPGSAGAPYSPRW